MVATELPAVAARLVVGGALLAAAWSKLRDPAGFAAGVHDYGLLPRSAERVVALWLPAVELVLGICLLAGLGLPWVALAIAVLIAVFALVIAVTAKRGRDIPCHCFGASPRHRVGAGAVLRAAVLVGLALVAATGVKGLSFIALPASALTLELVLALQGLATIMALAVVLAEPLVLMIGMVVAAWRRAPDLKAAELSRRRTCEAVSAQSEAL